MRNDDVERLTAQIDELRRQVRILTEQTTCAVALLRDRCDLLRELMRLSSARHVPDLSDTEYWTAVQRVTQQLDRM
jgi:hypothetical protein